MGSLHKQPASHAWNYPTQGRLSTRCAQWCCSADHPLHCLLVTAACNGLVIYTQCVSPSTSLSLAASFFADSSTRGITYTPKSAAKADGVLTPEPIRRVLELPGVESVYALGDWLCLNKVPSAKWDTIVSFLYSCPNWPGSVTHGSE